tara:strand:+ start:876 stop:1517 length:642 start_codon:yes stop_codon:yes gene_type:complete
MANLDLREITAIYINLDSDTERNERMQSMLTEFGFKNVIRLSATEMPNRLAACSQSHYNALQEVDPPFIVFEDDCLIKNLNPVINIPDDSDAVYLGISSWGRMNGHSGPCVFYEEVVDFPGISRVYNMLGAHAILYLSKEYVSLCSKISDWYCKEEYHQDIGFAEVQKYYNVYAFDDPIFYQTSSNGTDQKLSSYPSIEFVQYDKRFWKPVGV